VSKEANKLKTQLRIYGVSAFVAHTSIRATLQWQNEIERALYSMDALAALMTEEFHASHWTDQEVGFALGRHVPVIPVRLGRNPYGFLARIQALSCNWSNAPERIIEVLIRHEGMFEAYVQAIRDCGSYDNANLLARILASVEELDDDQIGESWLMPTIATAKFMTVTDSTEAGVTLMAPESCHIYIDLGLGRMKCPVVT
jgi:TIR domain-containing protein